MTPADYERLFGDEDASLGYEIPKPKPSSHEGIKRGRILAEKALKTINGDRQDSYGSPEDSFALIASYWSVYTGVEFKPEDVAMMMALFKVAREQKCRGSHADNLVDMVGYSLLYGNMTGYDA